jgi:hypothetical protein
MDGIMSNDFMSKDGVYHKVSSISNLLYWNKINFLSICHIKMFLIKKLEISAWKW